MAGTTQQTKTNLTNHSINVKNKIALLLTTTAILSLGGTSFAGEKKTVYNNRGQVTAIVNESTATPASTQATKKKLIWNNRGQLIAVVNTPSR